MAVTPTVGLGDDPPACRSPTDLSDQCLDSPYVPPPVAESDGDRLVAHYERVIRSLDTVRGALPPWADALFVGLLTEVIRLAVTVVGDDPLVGLVLDIMEWTGDDGQPVDAIVVRACELLLGLPRAVCVRLTG